MFIHNIIKSTICTIIFTIFIYNCAIHASACDNINDTYSSINKILDMSERKNTIIFSKILNELDIPHDPNDIQSIYQGFKKFRRSSNQERWQIKPFAINEQQRQTILNLISELNLIQDIHASDSYFQYALILGATSFTIKSRIEYLGKEWSNGIRVNEIVLLGSNRKLNTEKDYSESILHGIFEYIINNNLANEKDIITITSVLKDANTDYNQQFALAKEITAKNHKLQIFSNYLSTTATEADAALAMFHIATIPQEMQNLPVSLISAPDVKRADNIIFRANTADTINYWMNNYDIKKTSVLAVSNQPYVIYQQQVLYNQLKNKFNNVDIIGEKDNAVNKLAKIELYLDTLALFLHNYLESGN